MPYYANITIMIAHSGIILELFLERIQMVQIRYIFYRNKLGKYNSKSVQQTWH